MLEVAQEREDGGVDVKLTRCPVCHVDIDGRPSYHIEKHRPEDFGLTPKGERPDRPATAPTEQPVTATPPDLLEVPTP